MAALDFTVRKRPACAADSASGFGRISVLHGRGQTEARAARDRRPLPPFLRGRGGVPRHGRRGLRECCRSLGGAFVNTDRSRARPVLTMTAPVGGAAKGVAVRITRTGDGVSGGSPPK